MNLTALKVWMVAACAVVDTTAQAEGLQSLLESAFLVITAQAAAVRQEMQTMNVRWGTSVPKVLKRQKSVHQGHFKINHGKEAA